MEKINLNDIERYSVSFEKKNLKVLQNSVRKNGINNATFNTEAQIRDQHIYSVDIKTGAVANQKQSGRCWMFAALNTFRHKLNKEYKLKDFELSQTYTFFYDKLEKSNYFLENIIKTLNEDLDSRLVHFLLATPQQDGGQWDMLASLIEKYGIVPKYAMPEAFHSTSSMRLDDLLNKKLRKSAQILRTMNEEGKTLEEIREKKDDILNEIYSFLVVSLGKPPKTFTFEYEDKDGIFHRDIDVTPKEFFDKYVGINLNDYISLINAPTKDKPYHRTFTVDYLGNVLGGRQVKYLNVTMDELKQATISQLQDGVTVWFGCDVGQSSDRKLGILDSELYNYDKTLTQLGEFSKVDRLLNYSAYMTHAMTFVGVDLDDEGKPLMWEVENSWGDEVGKKGIFSMSDKWFDDHNYSVVVDKKYISDEFKDGLDKEVIKLDYFDPLG